MNNPSPAGSIYRKTKAVVKWSEVAEGLGDEIYDPLCVVIYKETEKYIVDWLLTDPYSKIN